MSIDRERPRWTPALGTALLVALPLALAAGGLLLPEDPDDPNTKALIAAVLLVVPVGIVAALVGFVTVRIGRVPGRAFVRALVPTTALATSAWLLLFAWLLATATPVPGTQEEVLTAQSDPHLWSSGAWRTAAAAALLAAVGVFVGWRTATRQPPRHP